MSLVCLSSPLQTQPPIKASDSPIAQLCQPLFHLSHLQEILELPMPSCSLGNWCREMNHLLFMCMEIFEKLPDQLQGFELLAIVTNYLDWNVLGKRFDGIFFWNWSDFISVVRSLNTPICSWKAASLVSCTRTKQFSRMQIILPCLNDHWFSKSTGWLLNLWMWIQNALHIAYHIILLCRFVLPNMSNSNSHLESFKYI